MNPSRFSRRDFWKMSIGGVAAATSASGWLERLAAQAATQGPRRKSCILLFMSGAPSHIDTFDMKPDAPAVVRGEFRPIDTAVPGIQICEHFPRLSRLMRQAAIIRSMSTREGDHIRGRYHMHTGYRLGAGGLAHPSLGSLVAKELGDPRAPLPNFIAVNATDTFGAGFLGPQFQPLQMANAANGVENLRPANLQDFNDQARLLDDLEEGFLRSHRAPSIQTHRIAYQQAAQLAVARDNQVFDLSQESAAVRASYGNVAPYDDSASRRGRGSLGQGCLMARRLVEAGVPFVEVVSSEHRWDTHSDNFPILRQALPAVDNAMSMLITDLHDRGLLDSTLVIWMGEFGRTPRLNGNGGSGAGRDHWSSTFCAVLAGGGIRGGQVIGRSDSQGAHVADRPVSAKDFMATVCRILGIDYTKENTAQGRPVRIVDQGENPIRELLG